MSTKICPLQRDKPERCHVSSFAAGARALEELPFPGRCLSMSKSATICRVVLGALGLVRGRSGSSVRDLGLFQEDRLAKAWPLGLAISCDWSNPGLLKV